MGIKKKYTLIKLSGEEWTCLKIALSMAINKQNEVLDYYKKYQTKTAEEVDFYKNQSVDAENMLSQLKKLDWNLWKFEEIKGE